MYNISVLLFSVYTLGHVGRFQKKLEKRIRNQEREIERMCGFHYSHFVEAIEELSGIQDRVENSRRKHSKKKLVKVLSLGKK